jgi:uncharacterized protein YecA (UPF0149 family)
MGLLETWRHDAYEIEDEKHQSEFWQEYFDVEKGIYSKVLDNPSEMIKGTVSGLAEHYKASLLHFTGFLDGINDSLKDPLELEGLEEDSNIEFEIDLEKLYYNMLEAKADWLYGLPQWNDILTEEKKKEIYKEQRLSGTVIREEKIGRNEPCPCGSGKKYKKCCGANI